MSEQKTFFAKIVNAYVPYINAICSSFSVRYREDLIQEGFLGLYQACGAYDVSRGTPFDGFAKVCIKNQIFSGYRALKKDDGLAGEDELENCIYEQGSTETDTALAKEFFCTLRAKLTDTECRVLDEYFKDRSYEDIASALNLTPKKVDNALSRIKKKIRLEYEP